MKGLALVCLLIVGQLHAQSLEEFLGSYTDSFPNYGMVVLHDSAGHIETEAVGWSAKGRPMEDSSVFCIGSVSKMFTSTLVHRFVEQGRLHFSDTLGQYMEMPKPWMQAITVNELLHHASRLDDFERLSDMVNESLLDPDFETSDSALMAQIPGEPRVHKGYAYSNVNYFLLRLVLEQQSDSSIEQLLEQHVFRQLGIPNWAHTYSNETPNLAHPIIGTQDLHRYDKKALNALSRGDGNLVMRAQDLNRFLKTLLFEETLITNASREHMTKLSGKSNAGAGIFREFVGTRVIWGHTGRQLSYICYSFTDLNTGEIWIIMTNNANDEISDRLFSLFWTR